MQRVCLFFPIIAVIIISACGPERDVPQDGDIIFQESKSNQSPIIKLAQSSKWTHCGVIFHMDGKVYVYEAEEPVKYTPLKDWIARGKNGTYCAKRLKNKLTADNISKMKAIGRSYKGKHYDVLFEWNDDKMYCSELVWKIYAKGAGVELCQPEQFSDFPIENPKIKKVIEKRYSKAGKSFNPSEPIVSPYLLYKSKFFQEVRYAEF